MSKEPKAGIDSFDIETSRIRTHLRVGGTGEAVVVFVHGNVSSGRFFEGVLGRLPAGLCGIAPDLRGFGRSEQAPVDARRGVRDFSEDLAAALEVYIGPSARVHLVGWSLGGGVVMQYAVDHPEQVASVLLSAPMPPFGVGGTKGPLGEACFPDFAGSGAGLVNREFVARLATRDTSADSELSPRVVMRRTYFAQGFNLDPTEEEALAEELLFCSVGDANYPGDWTASPNWPGLAPGDRGVNNAISPRHCDLSAFATAALGAPVAWLHGREDAIVSDASPIDPAVLGEKGLLPGWPGASFPAQPMLAQLRHLLSERERAGGAVREVVLAGCGHSPHIEQPEAFGRLLCELVEQGKAPR